MADRVFLYVILLAIVALFAGFWGMTQVDKRDHLGRYGPFSKFFCWPLMTSLLVAFVIVRYELVQIVQTNANLLPT